MEAGITVYDYMDTFFCCKVEKDKWCEEMVSEHMFLKKEIPFSSNVTI